MTKAEVNRTLQKRFKVLITYPNTKHSVGTILAEDHVDINYQVEFPHIFKPIKWYEGREDDYNLLMSIKYVKIVEYIGYWRVDDIVEVKEYAVELGKFTKFNGFYLGDGKNHLHPLRAVEPSCEEDYKIFKKKQKDGLIG